MMLANVGAIDVVSTGCKRVCARAWRQRKMIGTEVSGAYGPACPMMNRVGRILDVETPAL